MTDFVIVSTQSGIIDDSSDSCNRNRPIDISGEVKVKQEPQTSESASTVVRDESDIASTSLVVDYGEGTSDKRDLAHESFSDKATATTPAIVNEDEIADTTSINDIGLWPDDLTREHIDSWAQKGSKDLQNCDATLLEQKSIKQSVSGHKWFRKCKTSMFERHNRNGEVVKRSWLCFSPAMGRVYCFVCKLMATSRIHLSDDGFCDWKHASDSLGAHETSKDHLDAVVAVYRRANELGVIQSALAEQVKHAETYWRSILRRLVSVIKFACERGLALRGDNQLIGSSSNGNYLGMLELLAEYDDFLSQHIQKHANLGSGHTNYLSSVICEELVEIMGTSVLNEITSRIKESRYYSISLDSTPDESHVDQLTLVFRYIEKYKPVERFVKFMPNQGHKAQDMFDGLMTFLNQHGIDIKHCRGQSYDNATAMSGKYNGLQAKVAAENNLAAWIPCAGLYSLYNILLSIRVLVMFFLQLHPLILSSS